MLLRRLALACALLFAALPAHGAGFAAGSRCHALGQAGESFAEVAAQPGRWTCADRDWSIAAERVFLRFDLRGVDLPPARFDTRAASFAALHVATVEVSGRVVERSFKLDQATPKVADWRISVPLPGDTRGAEAVYVTIDRPGFAGVLTAARLTGADEALGPDHPLGELALAAILGLLIGPLLLNLAFFRAMREPFLLWHALAVAFMLAHTAIASGIAHRLTGLPMSTLIPTSTVMFGFSVAAAAMFSAAFFERGTIDPSHRRVLHWCAPWIVLITLLFAFAPEALRSLAPRLFFAGYLPVLIAFVWTMHAALRRGSRAAKFLAVAWTPMMLVGLVRIGYNAFTTLPTFSGLWAQHLAIVAEVLITAFGVADRFLILRLERDRARTQVRALASEAGSDVLTGLMNRRGLEQRFAALRAEGFVTMAVLDLDNFKAINDTHGHAVGDEVLRAVARALEADPDTVAARLGGEEFVLLLRGSDVAARAERRRAAIPLRVSTEVAGLGGVVTASMGLVEQAPFDDFALLYAHCDRLLYEAKRDGRNRTASERLQSFGERRGGDRRKRAAQAA